MNHDALPVFQHKDRILDCYNKHSTLIIVGETGSGKSTQVPKFIYENGLTGGQKGKMVAVTQPRRVAAMALAKRVAEEMNGKVGDLVGYSVRFDEAVSAATRIKYLTDGMLLREALSDKSLSRYECIILDEAHERTLRTDILFGMLKRLQNIRHSPLKIVIMSATLNPEKFVNFFSDPYVLNIPGRQFPVRLCYTAVPQQDYLDAAIVTIFQLHRDQTKKGDILVFLTGQEEIDTVAKLLEEYGPSCSPPAPKMIIVPVYAALSSSQQMSVFRKTPEGCRKIVLATNIAETSITIPGIRFVVDPGFVKMRVYNPRVGMETLSVVPVSKASCRQRTGRAGREAPGECYRLFTEEAFRALEEETAPEILRTNLSNVILTMKACGIDDVVRFDYMERPSLDSIAQGLEELLALNAFTDSASLTKDGQLMAECPLAPQLSRVLMESAKLACTEECLSIIAMLSMDNIFTISTEDRAQSTVAKKNMSHSSGDHLTLLNIYNAFKASKEPERWCRDNFVDLKSMKQVIEVRNQLQSFCEKSGLKIISCGPEYDSVLQSFCAGFHTQLALLQPDRSFKTLLGRHQVFVHPSSVLHMKKPECILYHEVTMTSKCYLRTVSVIHADWAMKYINGAFLYVSKPEDVQEFKPLEGDLGSNLLKLIKCNDEKRKCSVAMALHIHYQSCRLLDFSDEELIKYRSVVAKLNADYGAKEYAQVYNHSSPQTNTIIPTELGDFASPLLLPETILNILHGKVTSIALPKLESLFAYASVDSDAARYMLLKCFHVYTLSGALIKSLLSGRSITDQDHQRTFAFVADKLNSEFRLLLEANMTLQSAETTNDKPRNLERISKGYLNPSWDWNDKAVDPTVRFVYNFLRVDKPQDVRNVPQEDLEFKGSSELSCFHSQYMNRVTGKLFGCAVLLHGTFPDVLPESLPHAHFDTTIKLNRIVQQPIDAAQPAFKEWTSFCMAVNETLRLLNQENRRKIDAVWMFRNKLEPINSGYAGFLYACGLKGLLKELPMVAILDMLKSGIRTVQIGILLGLGLSYRGQYVEAMERVLSMHIRSHFMNTVKIQISADIQGAALLGYGFMYYNSSDRQAIKTLFSEFQRNTSQLDKTTLSYPPSFYLNAAIGLGMVSSGDMRNCLTGPQMDALLSTANGHAEDSDRQFAAIVALLLGALGTGDKALVNCFSLQDKHNVRPYIWFMKHFCRLCIEWTDVVKFDIEWTDEYSLFESAAKYLYSAIRCKSGDITIKLLDCLSSLEVFPIKETEGLAIKRLQSAKDFAIDVCLLSLSIANSGSRDARILRHLARLFSSCLQYNHGRSVIHSMAAGFLCMQNGQRLDLTDHFTISCIIVSSLPVWSRDLVDMTCYFMPLRYLWAMAVTTNDAGPGRNDQSKEKIMEASTILCENALFHAFTHNHCPWTPQQLADMFKKDP